jgi:hypothetical protein
VTSVRHGHRADGCHRLPDELLRDILHVIRSEREAETIGIHRTYGVAGECLGRLMEKKKAERAPCFALDFDVRIVAGGESALRCSLAASGSVSSPRIAISSHPWKKSQ